VRSFDRDGNVMLCASFSKTLAPGLATGWVAAGRWSARVAELKLAGSAAGVGVLELALAEMLVQGGYETALRRLRRLFAEQVEQGRRLVGAHFPRGTRVTAPSGGFFLWVELPRSVDAVELFRRCLEQAIVIVPGLLFALTGRFRHCIRLSVGEPWDDARRAALASVGQLACELARGVGTSALDADAAPASQN
jgi:DNA-binding transcriptional MocR family regulator